jgi:hypothetical protein
LEPWENVKNPDETDEPWENPDEAAACDWRGDGSFGPFSQKSFWENVKNPDESFGTD